MTSGIYAYWDNVNGYYAYVGKDSNIDRNIRHKQHLQLCRYDVQPFNKVIQNNPKDEKPIESRVGEVAVFDDFFMLDGK